MDFKTYFEAQLPRSVSNRPTDNDDWHKRLVWLYDLLRDNIRQSKSPDNKIIWLLGHLKQIVSGEVNRLDPEQRYINGDGDNPDDVSWAKGLTKQEHNFLAAYYHAYVNGAKTKSRNPEQSFENLWQRSKPLIEKIIGGFGNSYFWQKFVSKIQGRNTPRLTLEEQSKLIKGYNIPDWVREQLLGTKDRLDFDGMMRRTDNDLYEFPRLQQGGKVVQAMPEAVISTFFPRLKEGTWVNNFNYNKFMDFIYRFCDPKIYKRFFKQGVVYRVGGPTNKRQWYGASTSQEGIKVFIRTMGNAPEMTVNYGATQYFDMLPYIFL